MNLILTPLILVIYILRHPFTPQPSRHDNESKSKEEAQFNCRQNLEDAHRGSREERKSVSSGELSSAITNRAKTPEFKTGKNELCECRAKDPAEVKKK